MLSGCAAVVAGGIFYDHAVVSKRVDTPYRAGRTDHWLKCRCAVVETVAVVGFTGAKRINGLHVART